MTFGALKIRCAFIQESSLLKSILHTDFLTGNPANKMHWDGYSWSMHVLVRINRCYEVMMDHELVLFHIDVVS